MRKVPETKEEWLKYDKMMQSARKRRIPVIDIDISNIEEMWDYEYQAKHYNKEDELDIVIASNSLNKLKKEIRLRKWKIAWITTSEGSLSYGQVSVDEYPYIPNYK